jgi:Protein of unknown function (DUF3052)
MSAGYSATPLYKKLGLRPGMKVLAVGMPPDVREAIESGVNGVVWVTQSTQFEAAHLFATRHRDLKKQLLSARKALPPRAFIWVSWPKKSSAVSTDITEDRIRELAFPLKLVDIKVCAVTEIWSGLKLMIRIKDRK